MKVDLRRIIRDKAYCERTYRRYVNAKVLRKTNPSLFGRHLNRAVDNLDFANFILDEHAGSIMKRFADKTFYEWCVTIYYYSVYHASLALLTRIGLDSKGHAATITAVTLFYYHKDNVLKKEDVQFIIDSISLKKEDVDFVLDSKSQRERACYGVDSSFGKLQAEKMKIPTAEFVGKVRGLLAAKGG